MLHFGVNVFARKYGLEISRENYAIINNRNSLGKYESEKIQYADEAGKFYTDEWCRNYKELCLENYDLNMKFFDSLNHDEFENELKNFLKKNKNFVEIKDLNKYSYVSGYYIMVLDKFCQVYIGTTDDIKRRIQQHWSRTKNFDRLLFPMFEVEKSVLSIDSFRALDTTRIYVYKTKNTFSKEDGYINTFSKKFVTNRLGGGLFDDSMMGTMQAKSTIKTKDL